MERRCKCMSSRTSSLSTRFSVISVEIFHRRHLYHYFPRRQNMAERGISLAWEGVENKEETLERCIEFIPTYLKEYKPWLMQRTWDDDVNYPVSQTRIPLWESLAQTNHKKCSIRLPLTGYDIFVRAFQAKFGISDAIANQKGKKPIFADAWNGLAKRDKTIFATLARPHFEIWQKVAERAYCELEIDLDCLGARAPPNGLTPRDLDEERERN
ncbi:hypothetical protein DL96DRAFT_479251 [Flagelloscypha sp. PMI_526]|nr:hypothetical protein DL96DRAFT_479251 [Flagelloscypha sp. PMI_526]